MNITRNDINDLNSVITISVEQDDIQEKVDKILSNYRKSANVPGFRKGMAPMKMIKSQYEDAVKFDEINKLLQNSIQEYIKEQNLVLLGQPIPEMKEELDLNTYPIDFNFEIGISPDFSVDLSTISAPKYEIEVSEEDIDKTVRGLRKQFGESVESETVGEDSFMKVDVKSEDLLKEVTLWVDQLKDPALWEGKKVGDQVKVKAQDLYKDPHNLEYQFGMTHEESHSFNEELTITIKEIKTIEMAEMNEDFFNKAFPNKEITTEEQAREELKNETQEYYNRESNYQMLNDVSEQLIDTVQFDLPKDFLVKFIKSNQEGEEPMSEEKAEEEYGKSERALRYQLIEGKILEQNEVKVTPEQLMDAAKKDITQRMKSYGYGDIGEEELNQFAQQMLQNEQQIRQISDQVLKENLIEIYNEKADLKPKKVTFDEFIEIVKSQNGEKK